jgi:hypothetical protein
VLRTFGSAIVNSLASKAPLLEPVGDLLARAPVLVLEMDELRLEISAS